MRCAGPARRLRQQRCIDLKRCPLGTRTHLFLPYLEGGTTPVVIGTRCLGLWLILLSKSAAGVRKHVRFACNTKRKGKINLTFKNVLLARRKGEQYYTSVTSILVGWFWHIFITCRTSCKCMPEKLACNYFSINVYTTVQSLFK